MSEPLKILMLEDSRADAEIVQRLLTKHGLLFTYYVVMDRKTYLLALDSFSPDIILADNSLPQFNAGEALFVTRERLPHVPFILVTGTVSEDFAAGIIKQGADDYLLKDRLARLPAAIEAALKHRETERRNAMFNRNLLESEEKYRMLVEHAFDGIIIYSQSGKIIDCNQSACNYLGYIQEDLRKLSVRDLCEQEDVPVGPLYFERLKAGEYTIDCRKVKKKAGDYIDMEISTKMMPDGNLMAIGRDISERREAADQQALFASIINSSDDAIISKNLQGIISSWNKGACDLFGYTAEEVVGRHISIIIPPARIDDEDIIIEKIRNGESVVHFETERRKKDGSLVAISLTVSPVKNSKGIIIGASKIARDISKQKKAAEAIKSSNDRFEIVASATNDVIWDWNLETNSIWWNKNYYSHFGYQAGTAADISSWYNNIHSEDTERVLAGIYNVINSGGHSWTDEYRFLKADGTIAFVLDCGYILYSADGKPDRLVGAMIDITDRKKGEQQLTRSLNEKQALAERLSCILNTLPANIALLDSKGTLVEVNNAWKNFGIDNCFQGANYCVGENYIEMSAATMAKREQDAASISNGILSILQNKADQFVFEYCCSTSRANRWFRMVATPLQDKEYTGAVVMHIDISELKKLEQERLEGQLNEQKKITRAIMQTQEKERDTLGRELHDNLCQLLAAIKMKLSSCMLGPENSAAIIHESVQCLEDAINETRHLSHRMLTPRFADSSLANALDQLAALYNHGNRMVELDINFEETENIPAPLKETFYRIAQEQFNNIEKYAKASQVKVHLYTSHFLVRLLIEDNGAGFDPSKRRTGAGLTNIMNRAESFNGSAKVISSPGEGCILMVEIPLARSVRMAV